MSGIGPSWLYRPNELLRGAEMAVIAQSYFEWTRYDAAAQLHRQMVEPLEHTPVALRAVDPFSVCAAQLAAAQSMTQKGAEYHLMRALALRDRLPRVNALLKEGLITGAQVVQIIARTDLIEGSQFMADIDRDIAESLRRPGSWSTNRLRDMVDAHIFRRDPALVRENREDAKSRRGVWNNNIGQGMSAIDAVGSAEETGLIMARLESLAMSVCRADPRRKSDRMADALFAVVMGREFACQCPQDPKHRCTATIVTYPAGHVISGVDVKLLLHVIADQRTVDGEAEHPGHLQGYGVISADHVRDIARRDETVQRPMGNEFEQSEPLFDAADLAAEAQYAEFYAAEHAAAAQAHAAAAATAPAEPAAADIFGPAEQASGSDNPAGEPRPDSHAAHDSTTAYEAPAHPTGPEPAQPKPEPTPETEFEPQTDAHQAAAEDMPAGQPEPTPDRATGPTRATVYSTAPDDLSLPAFDEMAAAAATPPYWQPIPLPIVQPGNSYRPSTVLDEFLRMRDLYCMWPGCDKPAWNADLDHTREYNHHCPDDGGHTHPEGMKDFCRFHHLMKTHSDWLDDQYPDPTGRTRLLFTTPGGRTYHGPAWTGEDLFAGLRHIIFDNTTTTTLTNPPPPTPATRQHTRTQAKHVRRHQERMRNRQKQAANPPPF